MGPNQMGEGGMEEDRRWRRLAGIFFRPPVRPDRAETELFVREVMGRLEREDIPSPVWGWLAARWLLPALSLGAAALFLSIVWPGAEAIVPMDVLFLMEGQGREVHQLALPPDPSGADNLLAFAAEER